MCAAAFNYGEFKGSPSVSTPEKAAISRHYQQELSINKRGAARRTAAKFEKLAAMMLEEFNIELVQQPGNTPMYKFLNLTMWAAIQLGVGKMDNAATARLSW